MVDESITNTSFVALLKELGSISGCKSKWAMDHIDLKAEFRRAAILECPVHSLPAEKAQ